MYKKITTSLLFDDRLTKNLRVEAENNTAQPMLADGRLSGDGGKVEQI